ncbi:hypothetical protein [Streptacidiphilus sp. EB103A]|uniref:hypothetical protein n=1 Tax=Streptacidiphilus sp. EB103A TaxID=3156275 RepID=UPI0035172B2A
MSQRDLPAARRASLVAAAGTLALVGAFVAAGTSHLWTAVALLAVPVLCGAWLTRDAVRRR